MPVTRFAPSPTGHLHAGHAYAALFAARAAGNGSFLLRLEDIDPVRCRPEYASAIVEDLRWLGLRWSGPVYRQSARFGLYRRHLDRLAEAGLLYPCFCTRRDIRAEIARAAHAPHGPDGALYPGTCRNLDPGLRAARIARNRPDALRLDMAAAVARAGRLVWRDLARGDQVATPEIFGDVVLARKDAPASYHLAATVDDAAQGVDLVTRGEDLFQASHVHRLLQALLDLPVPVWRHHRLIADGQGRRLAKRDGAATLRARRAAGETPASLRASLGYQRPIPRCGGRSESPA